MYINDIIWLEYVVEKIESKHHVSPEEIEEIFYNRPKYRKAQKGKFESEDLYTFMDKQIVAVIFLWCLFIKKHVMP